MQILGSITNSRDLKKVADYGLFDEVFHLAPKKSVSESLLDPALYWKVNRDGTANALSLCVDLGINRIVAISSAAVYGPAPGPDLIHETDKINPTCIYSETKTAAELLISEASASGSISTILLRSFNLVGGSNSDFFDAQAENLLPIIIHSLKAGSPFEIYVGNFETPDEISILDYANVSDVAQAHIKARQLLHESRIGFHSTLNVSSGFGTSVLQLIEQVTIQSKTSLRTCNVKMR